MNKLRIRYLSIGFVVACAPLIIIACGSTDTGVSGTDSKSEGLVENPEATLQQVAKSLGLEPKDLTVLNQAKASLPHTKKRLTAFKLTDKAGQRYDLAVDESGNVLDHQLALQQEEEARQAERGAMSDALYAEVSNSGVTAPGTIPVLIKLKIPETLVDKEAFGARGPVPADVERMKTAQKAVEASATRMASALLGRVGAGKAKVEIDGPFVRAELTRAAITAAAWDKEVGNIGVDRQDQIVRDYATIAQTLPQTQTNIVHSSFSKRGAGINIASVDPGSLPTSPVSCFHLTEQTATGTAAWHPNQVLGMIGNRYGTGNCLSTTWEGYAPDASVFLANDPNYRTGWAWARDRGVNIATMSWHNASEETAGGLDSRDIYFDYQVVHYPFPTVVTSAGNQADAAYASGKGYNIMGVANVSNGASANRCDDTIDSTSSWKDPTSTHSDREVPALAMPGSFSDLMGSYFGGTSGATPAAAGIAADLMSVNTLLTSWPEAVRAIMLATANYQNSDGAAFQSWLEGRDGVGEVNALVAAQTALIRESTTSDRFRAHDYGTLTPASFSGGYLTKTWTATFSGASPRIRVALTWDSKVTGETGAGADTLDLDLDLEITGPNGSTFYSNSYDSSWEMVDFVPPVAGNYTIRVSGWNVPADLSRYFGIAWSAFYTNSNCN